MNFERKNNESYISSKSGDFAELGEMWQSLKNNNSAYSYEDLPSNLLGVGMYIRFSQDLALGNLTWHQALAGARIHSRSK